MIISKSNSLSSSGITLNTGTISSGALVNTQNADFSKVLSSVSSTFKFTFDTVGDVQYIGLHGLLLPVGAVVNITGAGLSETFTTTRDHKNLVFYVGDAVTVGTLSIEIIGAGTKTISYIQAGLVAVNSWGASSGQSLYYLGKTSKDVVSVTSRGAPIKRISEESSPTLRINMNNVLKSWVRGEFQEVLNHYDDTGILSIIDYPEDNRPDESIAGFQLATLAPTAHNSTLLLMNVSLSIKVLV